VARLGGDEFAFVLEGIQDQADAMFVAQKILTSLNEPVIPDAGKEPLSASLGISFFPDDAQDTELLLKYADKAMYVAKHQKDHVCFYKG
jgi:diguanylate cyclase (GGDEF)-like protein